MGSRIAGALLAGLLLLPGNARAIPAIEEQARLLLTLHVLPADDAASGASVATRSVEIVPGHVASLELDIPWPSPERPSHLKLEAAGSPGAGEEHDSTLESWLTLPDGRTSHAKREVRIREGTTRLVEIFAEKKRRLILGVEAEKVLRPVVRAGASATRAVRLGVEVQRVQGEQVVSLETNLLDTFVGEAVEYSFQRGGGDELEALRLLLRPIHIEGDLVEVSIEVTGTLPGAPTRLLLSRSERFVASRGAASSVTVSAEGSSAGYRFVITPAF